MPHLWEVKSSISEICFHPKTLIDCCHPLSKIIRHVERELDISAASGEFWTDSQFALVYMSNEAQRFETFAANHVQFIMESTNV